MKEYGGYLPLELDYRKEYYETNSGYEVRRFNSGRASIYQAIKDSRATRVWLPLYLCDTVYKFLRNHGVDVVFYNVNKDFIPTNIKERNGDIIVWTTYFGVTCNDCIQEVVSSFDKIIIDNTQGFYIPPQPGCYNVYSCRKFFGVPDGAYLISNIFQSTATEYPCSNPIETIDYLLKVYHTSTNEEYEKSLVNEDRISSEDVLGMSKISRRVLESVNYKKISKKRKDNFLYYQNILGKHNELRLKPPEFAPMIYPCLIKDDEIRGFLIKNHIYIPQWWKAVYENPNANEWEKYISMYLLPLPLDQRYEQEDIEYVAGKITESVR